jgi:hypothetical protein
VWMSGEHDALRGEKTPRRYSLRRRRTGLGERI